MTYIRRFLLTPYKILRQDGPLFLVLFIFKWLRWKSLTIRIHRLYFASKKRQRSSTPILDETPYTEEIVTYGLQLISEAKTKFAGSYSERKDLRFLFNFPPGGGAQHFYFLDLSQCLEHVGLNVRLYTASTENLEEVMSDFHPTVFITGDVPFITHTLDTQSLLAYKEEHGLARLFVPSYRSPLKPVKSLSSKEEEDRLALHRKGKLADAFIGYFEDVFWDVLSEAWQESGLHYHAIPFAANPLRHYPLSMPRDLDWGIATANVDLGERALLTNKYMRRIIRQYNGAIAGYNWGKGIDPIPAEKIAQFFCRVRISPNIAARSNVLYPIDCGAKVHELSAMGVFQLATEAEAIRKYYSQTEIVGFRDPKEFNVLFDYFLDKPQARLMFTKNSMARTLAENTYFQRITRVVEMLDQHPGLFH